MQSVTKIYALFIAVLVAGTHEIALAAPEPLPSDLKQFLAQVHGAAKRKDLVALKAGMIQEFTWSFGGDRSADQALEEWRKDAKYLKALAAATQGSCSRIAAEFECPAKAGSSFRAGFKRIGGSWKMTYFVAGD